MSNTRISVPLMPTSPMKYTEEPSVMRRISRFFSWPFRL